MTTRLHAIVDTELAVRAGWTPIDLARAFFDGGATLIQLRAKQLSSAAFLDLADAAVALAHSYGADVIINDRADIALISGAAGVHDGILVQSPLPKAMGAGAEQRVFDAIAPEKDVDGLTPINVGRLVQKRAILVACTPSGVIELLDREKIAIAGRHGRPPR